MIILTISPFHHFTISLPPPHLAAQAALVHIHKEVVFFLVGAHIDEPDAAYVTSGTLGLADDHSMPGHLRSPFLALGHVVGLSHVEVAHLFPRVGTRAFWARESWSSRQC